ncbi:MAG: potassium transporter TrkG, partial [Christensenellales bacterium]
MSEKKLKIRLSPSIKILLGFFSVILIGAILLCLPISNKDGQWLSFVDAYFTSTSAVCVTGLVVVDTGANFTLFGQIIILLLIQVGGLGTVALTSLIFLILGKKINFSNRMALKESLNRDSIQGIVKFLKKVILITFIIEGVGALCLLYSTITYCGSFWKGLFSAIFMSVSSFCNAG